jgi:predicted transcriptional regulator of viral defense system
MNGSHKILELARQNNGVITTSIVVKAGFSRGSLKYLSDSGQIERTSRGVYILPEVLEDEFVNIQSRYKKGIYSLYSSLFLCDLTDRTPMKFHMVFPSTYNLTNPKNDGIVCSGSKEPLYSLGVTELSSPGGNKVKSYSAERTLCDILRPRNHVDIQVVTEAIKQYISRPEKNIPLLSEYAKVLHVEDKLRSYLEVLL